MHYTLTPKFEALAQALSGAQPLVVTAAPHKYVPAPEVMDMGGRTRVTDEDGYHEDIPNPARPLTPGEKKTWEEFQKFSPKQKQMAEIDEEIRKATERLSVFARDRVKLTKFVGIITAANAVLRKYVTAKNSAAIDVMSTYGDFAIPGAATVLDADAQTTSLVVTESVAQNAARDIVRFTQRLGYVWRGDIPNAKEISAVIAGIRLGRYLKTSEIANTGADLIRALHDINDEERTLSHTIEDKRAMLVKLQSTENTGVTHKAAIDSVIDSKRADIKSVERQSAGISDELEIVRRRIEAIKVTKNKSPEQLQEEVNGLEARAKDLKSKIDSMRGEIESKSREVKRLSSGMSRTVETQEARLQAKLDKMRLALNAKYANTPNAKTLISSQLKTIEKNLRNDDKASNASKPWAKHADEIASLNSLRTGLDTVSSEYDNVMAAIKTARIGLSLGDTASRSAEVEKLQQKSVELQSKLKNAQRRIKTREESLRQEFDPEYWELRVTQWLDDSAERTGISKRITTTNSKAALMHSPAQAALVELTSGADNRAREAMRVAWNSMKTKIVNKSLDTKRQTIAGGSPFVVNPAFAKFNDYYLTAVSMALTHVAGNTTNEDLVQILTVGGLDTVNAPGALEAHKQVFNAELAKAKKWLISPKGHAIFTEIVQELVDAGKLSLPRVTKAAIEKQASDFAAFVVRERAIERIGARAWDTYRSGIMMLIRNTIKVDVRTIKPTTPVSGGK